MRIPYVREERRETRSPNFGTAANFTPVPDVDESKDKCSGDRLVNLSQLMIEFQAGKNLLEITASPNGQKLKH